MRLLTAGLLVRVQPEEHKQNGRPIAYRFFIWNIGKMSVRRYAVLLLLLAFAVRLAWLPQQSLWWDEGISLHLATIPIPDLLADRLNNIHPPLYFLLLKGWSQLVGVGVFNGRYFSTLASLLQVATLYAAASRWFGRSDRRVWTAVLLLIISPLGILYAQEMRVYALLPAVYLGLLGVAQQIASRPPRRWLPWAALGLLEWLALHLHYVVAFGVVYVNLWLLWCLWPQRQALRRWLEVSVVTGAATLPWYGAVVWNLTAVRDYLQVGTHTTDPIPVPALIGQVWGFMLTGRPAAFGREFIWWGLLLAALLLAALLLWRLWQPATRQTSLALLLAWLLPLLSAFVLWSVRSFSHPRYVIIYAIVLWPLLAQAVWGDTNAPPHPPLPTPRALTIPLLLLLTALSLWGTGRYFFDPAIAKDDVRGATAYLETVAQPGDLIVVPDTDWSLPFEYDGVAQVVMPGLDSGTVPWASWAGWTRPGQMVYVLDYALGTLDWQQTVPFLLESAGRLQTEQPLHKVVVRGYRLDRRVVQPEMVGINGRFPALDLQKLWLEPPADQAVTLALQWQLRQATPRRLSVALRLQDEAGVVVGSADQLLLDAMGRPTEQWQAGQIVTTYHLLPIAPGTPPQVYQMQLGLYATEEGVVRPLNVLDEQDAPQGQQLALGSVVVQPAAVPGAASPYGVAAAVAAQVEPVWRADGLVLTGVVLPQTAVQPGQSLLLGLRWESEMAAPAVGELRLALWQDGVVVADAPALPPAYPLAQWRAGEVAVVQQRLTVPPTVSESVDVVLLQEGKTAVLLGQLPINANEHLFTPPQPTRPLDVVFGNVARLIGYDLAATTFTADETVPLTLYWESLATGITADYTVFAHLLAADGRLIGQHDAPPLNGRRPTTGWVAGEFLVDRHEMVFREGGYTGTAVVEVGLYDPITGQRLTTAEGGDVVYLPVELAVVGR